MVTVVTMHLFQQKFTTLLLHPLQFFRRRIVHVILDKCLIYYVLFFEDLSAIEVVIYFLGGFMIRVFGKGMRGISWVSEF